MGTRTREDRSDLGRQRIIERWAAAEVVLTLLDARRIADAEAARARIDSCRGPAQPGEEMRRAGTAGSAGELLA